MRNRVADLLFLLPLWFAISVSQAEPMADLERYFNEVDTLSGQFIQETTDANGALVEAAEGQFVIARPERFVWHYETPYEQEIIADGERLWVYDVDLDQAVVRPLDEALGIGAAQLLSGDIEALKRSFDIRADESGDLLLTPTDPAWSFQQIRLRFDEGAPKRMEIADGMDQIVVVVFQQVAINPPVADDRFEFVLPAGVDLIDGM